MGPWKIKISRIPTLPKFKTSAQEMKQSIMIMRSLWMWQLPKIPRRLMKRPRPLLLLTCNWTDFNKAFTINSESGTGLVSYLAITKVVEESLMEMKNVKSAGNLVQEQVFDISHDHYLTNESGHQGCREDEAIGG